MNAVKVTADQILRTFVTLTLLSTFASSLIWGINTLFLLDAGLSITAAFMANAFFTLGQVVFEIPTGVVADTWGRRTSYLLGSATLFASTVLYLWLWQIHGPFWGWAAASILLGLGFTFFSGAVEAWLVDGLTATKYQGSLESAFGKGQIATGSPRQRASLSLEVRTILKASLDHGLRNPPVRWVMLAAPFATGVAFYAFYAMQPYLLELYGSTGSYGIAGLAAAVVAGAQICGGITAPHLRRLFRHRTAVLMLGTMVSSVALLLIGWTSSFGIALVLLAAWAVVFAAGMPVRQAYLNGLIPSQQRATVLSSDNLLGSSGGIFIQPALGKVADVWSYSASYLVSSGVALLSLPFIILARREHASSDAMLDEAKTRPEPPAAGGLAEPIKPGSPPVS